MAEIGELMKTINRFTGKPQPDFELVRNTDGEKCDYCGTEIIYNCCVCGALMCCPECCRDSEEE